VEPAQTAWLDLGVAIRRRLQLLNDAKSPNNKLVDFEPPDSSAANRQTSNSESTDGQRANRDGGKCQRPNRMCSDRLCPDADRWAMTEPNLGIGSIVVGDACTAVTRRHQMALDGWFDFGKMRRWVDLSEGLGSVLISEQEH
jgi:hypothetical protein